jgi:ABC-2 type transport system permease protein
MSTSELSAPGLRPASSPAPLRSAGLRLFRSELRLVLLRRRNQALVAVLCLAPVLIGVAVRLSRPTSPGDGPPFLSQITENGLFLVFTALTVTLPVFLPLAVAVCAGESVAGEASTGTLRNLLVVPVGRTRVLAVKYGSIVVFAAVVTFAVAAVGILVGLLLFPHGDVLLLSGTTVSYGNALGRALLVALYVTAMLAGVAAIGLFVSTLTEVPVAAMATTAILTVASEIADAIPQISGIHRYLFTHPWLTFGDFLRSPLELHSIQAGLVTQAAYLAVFLPLAWARLTTKDITC